MDNIEKLKHHRQRAFLWAGAGVTAVVVALSAVTWGESTTPSLYLVYWLAALNEYLGNKSDKERLEGLLDDYINNDKDQLEGILDDYIGDDDE